MKFKSGRNEYMVDCDTNCNVTLRIKTDRKKIVKVDGVNKESDEYIYDVLGYFNSIEQCFNWFLGYTIKQKGKSDKLVDDLKAIINAINEAKEEIKEGIKDIVL